MFAHSLFCERRYLMIPVLLLLPVYPPPGFARESILFELGNGVPTTDDIYWQPGDPYYYCFPIPLRISHADLLQSATLTLDLNPFAITGVRSTDDADAFSIRLDSIGAGFVRIVFMRTQPSDSTVRDCSFEIVPDRYVPRDLGDGFGSLRFRDVQVDPIDNRDVQVIMRDGSWYFMSDFIVGFRLSVLSAVTGSPIEGAQVTLMGMEDLPELFFPGLMANYPTDSSGRCDVTFNGGCLEPLFNNRGHAIDLDFVLRVEPPEDSGINPQTVVVHVYPEDSTKVSFHFQPATIIIGPTSAVEDWGLYE